MGPGLWPGPRRQARWVGRGSRSTARRRRVRARHQRPAHRRPPTSSPAPWRPPARVPLLATVLAKEPLPGLERGPDLGALGGTRTPNLLIRSYRRGPARSQRCRPAPVLMPAEDGRSAHGLLYLAAVRTTGVSKNIVKVTLTPAMLHGAGRQPPPSQPCQSRHPARAARPPRKTVMRTPLDAEVNGRETRLHQALSSSVGHFAA